MILRLHWAKGTPTCPGQLGFFIVSWRKTWSVYFTPHFRGWRLGRESIKPQRFHDDKAPLELQVEGDTVLFGPFVFAELRYREETPFGDFINSKETR